MAFLQSSAQCVTYLKPINCPVFNGVLLCINCSELCVPIIFREKSTQVPEQGLVPASKAPETLKHWMLRYLSFGCTASTLHTVRGNSEAGSQGERYYSDLLGKTKEFCRRCKDFAAFMEW